MRLYQQVLNMNKGFPFACIACNNGGVNKHALAVAEYFYFIQHMGVDSAWFSCHYNVHCGGSLTCHNSLSLYIPYVSEHRNLNLR